MTDLSTPRAAKHHLQPRLLAALCERVLMRSPDARLLFAQQIEAIRQEDPAFAADLDAAFLPGKRGPRAALSTSPLATLVQNVATNPHYVTTLGQIGGNVATFPQGSLAEPSPQVPPGPPSSPLRGEWSSRRSGPTTAAALPSPSERAPEGRSLNGRARDYHWEALEQVLGPCRTKPERDARNAACQQFRDSDVTPEEIIRAAEMWRRKMGDMLMTAHSLAKYMGQVLEGPSLGRHVQTLYETATHKHQRGLQR